MKEGVHRFYEQDSEIRKQWYTRDITKSDADNTNYNRYSAPAANWRDTLNCTMAPKSPNPEELSPPCRKMSNLVELEFAALNLSGNNYLSWLLDMEIYLIAMGLGDTIVEDNNASAQDRAKAMIIIRRHIQEELKNGYLTIKDPLELWTSLKERYDHQKLVILPKVQYDWMHLQFQDYKSVSDYNSAMFKIVSRLKLCGKEISEEAMIEKTLSTFHETHLLLQEMYRLQKFKKYSELMTCLLVAEQNNEILMQNHNARPTGSAPFPEVNGSSFQKQECRRGRGGWDHGRSMWTSLKERYDYQKLIILPKAQYDWIQLRFQDYKFVSDYNSAMFKIVSQLKLCGKEISEEAMIEKTLSTFHATHLLLQQMYRLKKFKKYSELMTCLLVAEQNNEILMRNYNARPTSFEPFPEANGTLFQRQEHSRGCGGRDRGRSTHQSFGDTTHIYQKLDKSKKKRKGGRYKIHKPSKDYLNVCFRCGTKGHWSRVCCTPKHLVELYQASTGKVSREKRNE